MSLSDYVWLTFFIIGVLCGLAICVDELIDAHRRAKSGNHEDWNP